MIATIKWRSFSIAIYTSSAVLWFENWIIIFHLHTQTRCQLLYWKSINVLNKWCSDYISRINNWLMWFQIDTEIVNFHRIFSYCNAHTSALAFFRSFIIKLNLFKFWITHWRLHTLHRKKMSRASVEVLRGKNNLSAI